MGGRFGKMPPNAVSNGANAVAHNGLIVVKRKHIVPRASQEIQAHAVFAAVAGTFKAAEEVAVEKRRYGFGAVNWRGVAARCTRTTF